MGRHRKKSRPGTRWCESSMCSAAEAINRRHTYNNTHTYTHVHTRISLYFFSIILAWHSMKKQKTSRVSYELIIDPPFEFWISLVFLKRKRNNKTWIGNISKTLLCVVWYYNLATTFLIYQRKIEMQNEQVKTWIVMENKTRKKKKKKWPVFTFVCLFAVERGDVSEINRTLSAIFFFFWFVLPERFVIGVDVAILEIPKFYAEDDVVFVCQSNPIDEKELLFK